MATGLSNRIIARAPSTPSAPSVKGLGSGNNKGYQNSQPSSKANSQARNAANQSRANATATGAQTGSLGIADAFSNYKLFGGLTVNGGENPYAAGGAAGGGPPPDPRDSTYWEQIAQNNLNKSTYLNNLGLAGKEAEIGYQRNIGNEDYRDPIELRELREAANSAGGIFSTATSERQGNLAQEQLMRRLGIQEEYGKGTRERKEQEAQILAEYGTGENGSYGQQGINAYEAAINRRINGG